MSPEQLSILAVVISGINAIISASIPAILLFLSKKAEIKEKRYSEEKEEFERFYNAHWEVLNNFSKYYEQWRLKPETVSEFVSYIHEISEYFQNFYRAQLLKFADYICNNKDIRDNYNEFQATKRYILQSYGVEITDKTPDDFLLPEILRIALKKRYAELKKSK